MGEAPGVMRPEDHERHIDASTAMDATSSDDPDEIRDGIEATRADMSDTIDAIQNRLDPETLKEQAKDAVRDATIGRAQEAMENVSERAQDMVSSTSTSIMDTIRENPIPTAMAGIGLGWLWMNRSKPSHQHSYYYRPERHTTRTQGRYSTTPGFARYADRESRYTSDRGDGEVGTMESARDAVSDAAGTVQQKTSQMASDLGDQASEWGDRAQDSMADMRSQAMDMYDRSPLVAGLLAVGIGMAVGMLVPETEKENEWMGETRDQLVDEAQSKARDLAGRAQDVAQDAAESAKESAEQHGMTTSS